MSICPHTIRVIEDWAGRKVQNSTKHVRGNSGFGFDFAQGGSGQIKSLRAGSNLGGSHANSKVLSKKGGLVTPGIPGEEDQDAPPQPA